MNLDQSRCWVCDWQVPVGSVLKRVQDGSAVSVVMFSEGSSEVLLRTAL